MLFTVYQSMICLICSHEGGCRVKVCGGKPSVMVGLVNGNKGRGAGAMLTTHVTRIGQEVELERIGLFWGVDGSVVFAGYG